MEPEPVARNDQYRGEDPVQRLTRIAAEAPAGCLDAYRPTPAAAALAGVLEELAPGETFSHLATKAGISRRALYDLLDNRAAVTWVVANARGTRIAEIALGLVHARLLNLALTDRRPAFIELYLKRFDPEFRRSDSAMNINVSGGQFAFLNGMSNEELRAYLDQKRRQVLGAEYVESRRT